MDLADLMNQQYEEVDSKEETKEEKVNIDEILKANEVTEKWLEEEREFRENSKDDNFSKSAFTKREVKSNFLKEREEEKKKEEKKSSSLYGNSSYSSRYYGGSSTSTETKKTSDELFYDKVEKSFNDKINNMVENIINKELNQIEQGCCWDILDMQYELNKKRISERYYEDEPEAKEFEKKMEKHSNACSRKVDIAELLILLKVNPNG